MTKILFVDDEPNVLSGVRRMLRTYRNEWDMSFCESGQAALELLTKDPHDVVVTDMRMPGMDGAALLEKVREMLPGTVRIVLSGHSDQELTLKAVGPAHQYLSKPCDPQSLRQAIERTVGLQDRIANETVRKLVASVESIPTLPHVYHELVAELSSPTASIDQAGRIIAQDLGMSSKVLQLVNSSFFGLPVRVQDVPHAVSLLGLGAVKPLVLSSGVFRQFEKGKLGGLSLKRLVSHSLHVAVIARDIAMHTTKDHEVADDAFMAGTMHDIGRLVLAQCQPERYSELCKQAARGADLYQLEREEFGVSHAEVGGYLLGLWGLPTTIVEAVAFHHEPSCSLQDNASALTALHAGEVIAKSETEWDTAYLERLGAQGQTDIWRKITQSDSGETAASSQACAGAAQA